MTIDKTLRVAKGLSRTRGVLTRAERLEKLKEQERWAEGKSIFGLPKVRVRKLALKKKKKAKAEGEEGADAAPAKGAAKGGAKK